MPQPLSERESELVRMLNHARACDGSGGCPICQQIDLRLADGLPHASDDPSERFRTVDSALKLIRECGEKMYGFLEGAPVPHSARTAAAQLVRYADQARAMLRLPVTVSDRRVEAAASPALKSKPPRTPVFRKPPRTPVRAAS